VPRSSHLGSGGRSAAAATQLDNTAEDRHATQRATAWLAGTRHGLNPLTASFSVAARGEEEANPTSGTGRTGRVSKTTRQPTCPATSAAADAHPGLHTRRPE
jgi:hypothetical protein